MHFEIVKGRFRSRRVSYEQWRHYAGHVCQIDAEDPIEFTPQIEILRIIVLSLKWPLLGSRGWRLKRYRVPL
jgi:hypothetical protein